MLTEITRDVLQFPNEIGVFGSTSPVLHVELEFKYAPGAWDPAKLHPVFRVLSNWAAAFEFDEALRVDLQREPALILPTITKLLVIRIQRMDSGHMVRRLDVWQNEEMRKLSWNFDSLQSKMFDIN